MLEISRFDFHENLVRVVMIDGAPWWFATDVCRALGYANAPMAVSRLEDDERMLVERVGDLYALHIPPISENRAQKENGDATGAGNTFVVISESGLYSLILTSRKPEAKVFKRWVTSEVLPSIRKTGGYRVHGDAPPPSASPLDLPSMIGMPIPWKLSMVRTADIASRNPSARRVWDLLELPALVTNRVDERGEEIAQEALQKIAVAPFAGRQVRHLLAEMLSGDEAAIEAARNLGFIHLPAEEGVAIASGSAFLKKLFNGEPFYRDLQRISGARPFRRLYFGRVQSRSTLIPVREIEDACSALYDGLVEIGPDERPAA